jgi:hypothetical protein
MTDVRHALKPAVRKLALARILHATLGALAISAGTWTLLVLLAGNSSSLFLMVVGACVAGVVLRLLLRSTTTLDAARRVERLADWREKLSTAVELEVARPDSPFYRRLKAEVVELLNQTPAAAFIPWDIQRLAVVAGVLVALAVSVTLLFPFGVIALLERSESSARRDRAADILQTTAGRLENASLDSPTVNEMRLELAGLLSAIRQNRTIPELQQETALASAKMGPDSGQDLQADAQAIAAGLGKTRPLEALAAAVGRLDAGSIPKTVQKVTETVPGLTPVERQGVADALSAAGEASHFPGLSDPLKSAARALSAQDFEKFQQAMREFGAQMTSVARRLDAEHQAADAARAALTRVNAVLAGEIDPGVTPTQATPEFFVEDTPPSTEAHGTGNLLVRSKPGDIHQVLEEARAAHVPASDLRDILRNQQSFLERPELSPEYRQYVRRYFTVETDNR